MSADAGEPDRADAAAAAADRCHICLGPFAEGDGEPPAALDGCRHVFCLPCIRQWAETANTCPVDRIAFTCIRTAGRTIKVRARTADQDEEEEAVVCEQCGRSDRRHQMLQCRLCDLGFHGGCLTPPLTSGAEGDWMCPECVATPDHADAAGVSDSELRDLLAELEEVAAPSPFSSDDRLLRPSTAASRAGRLAARRRRRRSPRIQSGSGEAPPPTQSSSWRVPAYLMRAARPVGSSSAAAAATAAAPSNAEPQRRT